VTVREVVYLKCVELLHTLLITALVVSIG
jgi:hypothetical protein